jgi:hypothetical protein
VAQDLRYILASPQQAQACLIRADANHATAACDRKADADAVQVTAQQAEDCQLNHGNYGSWGPNEAAMCRLPGAPTAEPSR